MTHLPNLILAQPALVIGDGDLLLLDTVVGITMSKQTVI
jgi:hypothetical protein